LINFATPTQIDIDFGQPSKGCPRIELKQVSTKAQKKIIQSNWGRNWCKWALQVQKVIIWSQTIS